MHAASHATVPSVHSFGRNTPDWLRVRGRSVTAESAGAGARAESAEVVDEAEAESGESGSPVAEAGDEAAGLATAPAGPGDAPASGPGEPRRAGDAREPGEPSEGPAGVDEARGSGEVATGEACEPGEAATGVAGSCESDEAGEAPATGAGVGEPGGLTASGDRRAGWRVPPVMHGTCTSRPEESSATCSSRSSSRAPRPIPAA